MGQREDAAVLSEMLTQFAAQWVEGLGALSHEWGEAVLAMGVFPQPDGQVQFGATMRTFRTEPAAGRHATVAHLFPTDHLDDPDDEDDGQRLLVTSQELNWMAHASPAALTGIANLMVDVHGMTPSLLWVQATNPERSVSIGSMPGDHTMDPRQVNGHTVLVSRHSTPAPWLTPEMVSDLSVLHHWVLWSGGRPQNPTGKHFDAAADMKATQGWRTYWSDGLDELEPEMLARLSVEQAVAMMLDDWLLVLHHYDTIHEYVLACRPSNRAEDPAGASRVLPRYGLDWADTPTADGQWVVVKVATYMNWADDDREGRCWAECTPEMRHQLLAEAFERAVVFTNVMDLVEWASTTDATGAAPLTERVQLVAALVDLPVPEMREVNARLEAGAGHGLIEHIRRPWDPHMEMPRFPVFVHNIPGRKDRADYEPPAEGTEYHLYYRDQDWLAWAGPMRAAAHHRDAVLAFITDSLGDQMRLFEVTTREIPIPPPSPDPQS